MNINKNEKGMTLVEVIVAMTLLGIMSGMFVTAAVYAAKANRDNYFRANEMATQAVDAAEFNSAKNYDMNEIRVSENNASGTADNSFTLEADFGTVSWSTTAYGYKSKLNDIDEDAGYQLKFFEGQDTAVSPDPSNGIYWVKFYNDSGVDLINYAETPELTGGVFFDVNKNSTGNSLLLNTPTGSISQFGFKASGPDLFGFTMSPGLYDADHSMSVDDIMIESSDFEKFCEKDASNNKTGYIIIHFNGSDYLSQSEFESGL